MDFSKRADIMFLIVCVIGHICSLSHIYRQVIPYITQSDYTSIAMRHQCRGYLICLLKQFRRNLKEANVVKNVTVR